MMTPRLILLCIASLLIAGCRSSSSDKNEVVLDEEQIKKALSSAKPPQQFGFAVYPTGNKGIAMRGSARLHPMQVATADFVSRNDPVIKITGSARRMKLNALIDTASAESWFEYSKAMEMRATFLGLDGRFIDYRGGTFIGNAEAYAAVIPQIRIDNVFIEDTPVYVRMAYHSLGPLNRGVQDSHVEGVLGYNTLGTFEFIQIDLVDGSVTFSATSAYTPNNKQLIGIANIVQVPGAGLVVQGGINGKPTPILLDIVGNYDFAMNNPAENTKSMVELGEVVYVNVPTVRIATLDGLPRIGANLLRKYLITICPKTGVVYFERPAL